MSSARCIDTNQVRKNFSCHAEDYDRYAVVQKRVVKRLLNMIAEQGEVKGQALDVGTGTGMLARGLLQEHPEVDVLLSDAAHGMSLHASSTIEGAQAVDADAQSLPFRSSHFSLVLSSSVYQWMNDLPLAFAESARVLKPGGIFAFALFGEGTLSELKDSFSCALSSTGGKGEDSHAQRFPSESDAGLALAASGLKDIRLVSEDEVEYHPDVPALMRSLKKIGANNANTEKPSGLASRRVMGKMVSIYEERYRCDRGLPATYQVVYGVARKAQ